MRLINYTLIAAIVVTALAFVGISIASAATDQPIPVLNNYEVVSNTITTTGATISVDSTCPLGKRALGGGGTATTPGASEEPQLLDTYPINGETGWRVVWSPRAGNPSELTATVICARIVA